MNPFRSSSLGVGEKGSFATTNKTLFRAWEHVEKAKLDDSKLQELKTHHFKLGSYAPNDVLTTNKVYHDRKPISGEAYKNQEVSKTKMRAQYHDFKEVPFLRCSKDSPIIARPMRTSSPKKNRITPPRAQYRIPTLRTPSLLGITSCRWRPPVMLHTLPSSCSRRGRARGSRLWASTSGTHLSRCRRSANYTMIESSPRRTRFPRAR